MNPAAVSDKKEEVCQGSTAGTGQQAEYFDCGKSRGGDFQIGDTEQTAHQVFPLFTGYDHQPDAQNEEQGGDAGFNYKNDV